MAIENLKQQFNQQTRRFFIAAPIAKDANGDALSEAIQDMRLRLRTVMENDFPSMAKKSRGVRLRRTGMHEFTYMAGGKTWIGISFNPLELKPQSGLYNDRSWSEPKPSQRTELKPL